MTRTREIVASAPVELTHLLVGGSLTANGIQWSDEVVTVTADTDYEVFKLTLSSEVVLQDSQDLTNDLADIIKHIYFDLAMAIKAGSATADVKFKWQARTVGAAAWVDLHDYITVADVGTSYVDELMSGYLLGGVTNIDTYPIEIRLVIQSNEATPGVATAKVKNSSMVIVEVC